jgi:hypothetical protein
MLRSQAVSPSTVTRWLREARFASHEQVSQFSEHKTNLNKCDEAILGVLNDELFPSIRTLPDSYIYLVQASKNTLRNQEVMR